MDRISQEDDRFAAWRQGPAVGDLGEFEVISRVRRRIEARRDATSATSPAAELVLGIGDDASLLRIAPGSDLVWTCDIQMEGRHFLLEWMSPYEVGARVAQVNMSDIAAMGARPFAALVSLGLPLGLRMGALETIYDGLAEALARHGAVVAGGNITKSEALFLDLTILGHVPTGMALRRSGAKAGDVVFVTGCPGRAAAALAAFRAHGVLAGELFNRFRRCYAAPMARIEAGRYLAESAVASAAIDQSDGIAADLAHICEESGVGIVLEKPLLPVDQDLKRLGAALGTDPLTWILGMSDDYELLFTVPREKVDLAFALPAAAEVAATPIGQVVKAPRKVLLGVGREDLRELTAGWDHLR